MKNTTVYLVMYGNPGTGKSLVLRLIQKYLKKEGIECFVEQNRVKAVSIKPHEECLHINTTPLTSGLKKV